MEVHNPEAHLDDNLSSAYRRWTHVGYIEIREHGKRWRLEHLHVAERMIGRKLRKGESVHHWNTIKTDNRPCNLRVMSSRNHCRVHGRGYFKMDSETGREYLIPTKANWSRYFNFFGIFYRQSSAWNVFNQNVQRN
jgi:hypothetical protein